MNAESCIKIPEFIFEKQLALNIRLLCIARVAAAVCSNQANDHRRIAAIAETTRAPHAYNRLIYLKTKMCAQTIKQLQKLFLFANIFCLGKINVRGTT